MAPMRRKSHGSIRSPHVKRNIQSQVTYEGWLFKLEGGALKQWKQRWCALVDFCLFFYKAPREEKVVSSILLPSYKINPCTADDKISKKFAFKAEHQNMKTYYFATEDKESMKKWMNAMSLATIMQNPPYVDDDESGFTSYRSRRDRSSSVPCTSVKQRSSSCGDRVGEKYLGSDDKYPAPSQPCKAQQRQPLYANAPPKPRRLTQTAIYPGEIDPNQYNVDRYGEEENTMQYLPVDSEVNNPAYAAHYASSYADADLSVPQANENSDVYTMKPPRPHSADFLEREPESVIPQYASHYSQNHQPQRPKSSLEYFNNPTESEDYEFDHYREAVRMQADNFYANKNIMKTRNFHENQRRVENVTKSDPRLNAHYNSQSGYISSDSVPSPYHMHSKEHLNEAHYRCEPAAQKLSSQCNNNKSSHNESMQRLLEWKQRMLQSPLSRRNQLQSTSSDTSSKHTDYSRQSLRHFETYKTNYSRSVQENNMSYQNQSIPYDMQGSSGNILDHSKSESSFYDSDDRVQLLYKNTSSQENQKSLPEANEKCNSNLMLADAADNLYKKNIMYCVDSENNEILFSYDTSPTESSVPAFHGSYYPPQMHSFTTLPNVNDIGVEPAQVSPYDPHHNRNKQPKNKRIQQAQNSADVEKVITYTSDDEDEVTEECDLKETALTSKEATTAELQFEEKYVDERYQSSSPDYVNISSMYRDLEPAPTPGVYSSDYAFRSSMPVNKAVLKQLKQVSKEMPEPDSSFTSSTSISESLTNCCVDKNATEFSPQKKGKLANAQVTEFIDEVDCDIKREDYYRASQIFYSSMRMKNRLGASPNKNLGLTNSCSSENVLQSSSPHLKLEIKPVSEIENLDKDIGLPMPAVKKSIKMDSPAKTSESISSEVSDTKLDILNSKVKNVANKFYSKLEGPSVMKDLTADFKEVKKESKKSLTYEEMRGQLLRKREAPPPNIVQERIKKFEKVKTNVENKKDQSLKLSKLSENTLHTHKFVNRSFNKRIRQKSNRSRCHKRILHSDSEAVAFDESDASSDDLTMKSAPILLSPLSSVLADLRKAADSNKEKAKDTSFGRIARKDLHSKTDNFVASLDCNQSKSNHLSDSPSKSYNDFILQNNEDSVYLPMYGIKAAIQEPEYVTMSGCKFSSSAAGSSKYYTSRQHEEHVYNEPFSPPPSFLHDVYEKNKNKQFQYSIDSTSDDSSTENIYEKPTQRFSFDSSRSIKSAQETNFVLMNSSSCSNVALNTTDKKASQNKIHHYEQAHISVSVPDLLQLQEIKDSDASDADDEASRDFDAPLSSACYAVQSSTNSNSDAYLNHPLKISYSDMSSPSCSMPCEKMPNKNSSRNASLLVQSHIEGLKTGVDDSEDVIHVRKLRVYTKGKKPEMPRMCPFNIDEAESTHSKYRTAKSFSENVAYVSQADIQSNGEDSDNSFIAPTASYAPDIISSIKEETNVSESSYSKSSTSAPYYYSDLYSEYGLNFSGQFPMNFPCADKISPPKSSTSLLNNIRSKSPCANKSDIGRKVNNINIEMKGKQTSSDKLVLKSVNDEEIKSNIKHSLDVYQVSESKYLDAEKNKYEAGSTLEKTRTSNTMSYFKHRASTPDLNQPNEPVYENMFFQSKRMSQSLEEINATTRCFTHSENNESELHNSPIYENIDFFNRVEDRPSRMPQNKQSQMVCSSKNEGPLNFSHIDTANESLDTFEKQCLTTMERNIVTEIADNHPVHFLDHNHPNHFLGQNTLKHLDKQQLHSKTSKSLFVSQANEAQSDSVNIAARPSINFENVEEGCSYKMTFNSDTPVYKVPKYKVIDLDSISDGTSSFDEASADSDNRHKPILGKSSSDGFHSCDSGLDITSKEASHMKKLVQRSHGLMTKGKRLSVSAGDLLGKTHEELVLLLIQLRRNQSKILKTKEKLEYRLKKERSGMLQLKTQTTPGQCEELYNQILYLEKQYKVMQPLVTLVDNMIKLGSLYGSSNRRSFSLPTLDRAQDLTPSSPSPNTSLQQTNILSKLLSEGDNLQKHVKEINELEKQFQAETNSLSTLHQDKEMLEHTLFGMRNKILDHQDRPAELQKLRKQQRMIEKELVRVKRLLNSSAKKIEDATSKNDQMEQEILHLRQLLQQALKSGSSETKNSQQNRADLEAELSRLQSVLDELANHRQEINNSVEKLKSEACSGGSKGSEVRASPTGVAGSAPLPLRKKHHCMYLETDLDTMVTRDLAVSHEKDLDDIPVYANAEEISLSTDEAVYPSSNDPSSTSKLESIDSELGALQDINDADERMKRFYGILPKEKPCEIKTVRIVKRQSERRSRERDKKRVTYDEQSSVWIMEEPDLSSDDYLENEESKKPQVQRPTSINLSSTSSGLQTSSKSAHERLFGSNTTSRSGTILQKHAVKKPKRRHYTVSGYQYMLDPQFSQYFTERPRSRDDVDMERCLRTANTPDIVRSTMKKKDVFDDTLIDRELGLPQKIEIPERYVEVEPEHLSATERLQRSRKAENICKMLSQTTTSYEDVVEKRNNSPEALHKKLSEEKRKRAQLLSLNQALAREVVERSKAVAANVYPLENQATS